MDDDITSKVLKFAHDTKVFRKIKSDADRQQLQDDQSKLTEWSEKWQMQFINLVAIRKESTQLFVNQPLDVTL